MYAPGLVRFPLKVAVATVLLALTPTLAACQSGDAEETAAPSASGAPASGGAAPAGGPAAAEAGKVGAAGSGCTMPVSFGIAASWAPKQVDTKGVDPELAALFKKGPMTAICEIDAKPAGNIGFIRVYTTDPGDLRTTLTAFIGAEAQAPAFTELQIGGTPALEVSYRSKNPLDDTIEQEIAFAVTTGQGVVAVSLQAFDDEEHAAMLPAYELAKTSLTVTG